MKKKRFFVLFGFLFGLCGMFCLNTPSFLAHATSNTASVWDGVNPTSENQLRLGEWYFDGVSYHINSAAAFAYFAGLSNSTNKFANSTVYLETDIDLANLTWTPVGNTQQFEGIFDGKGHTIFNVKIADSVQNVGLFGKIGGTGGIKNLNVRNFTYSSSSPASSIGALVGEIAASSNGVLDNNSAKGNISLTANAEVSVGGLAGKVSNVSISNSSSQVEISVQGSGSGQIGGLVGQATNANFDYSSFSGKIGASFGYIGGLVGSLKEDSSNFHMANCFNTGSISSNGSVGGNVGGLVGRVEAGTFTLQNSFNGAALEYTFSQSKYVGGLVGLFATASNVTISNAFSVGNLTGMPGSLVSPLFNVVGEGSVVTSKVYFDSTLANGDRSMAVPSLSLLAKTRDFYRNNTYFDAAWDFADGSRQGWKMGSANQGFPYFNLTAGQVADGDNDDQQSKENALFGEGTIRSPYLIQTAGDLEFLSMHISDGTFTSNPYFSLANDINLVGETWVPIGTGSKGFSGVFDGNGHTISGAFSSHQEHLGLHGLFGYTSNAVVKNLIVKNFTLTKGSVATGNLIASAGPNTYVVNCADLCANGLPSVGQDSSGGKLYVAYGRNNKNDTFLGGSLTTFSLGSINAKKAYDVAISGEGGNFYSKQASLNDMTSAIYLGEFHVILNRDGSILKQDIDSSFGQTALPGRSTGLGVEDVLIRRGFKLNGYQLVSQPSGVSYSITQSGKNWVSNFSSICSQAVDGLRAVWDSSSGQTFRVVYNAYELLNFNATNGEAAYMGQTVRDSAGNELEDKNGSHFFIQTTPQGQVYVDYVLEYDSLLAENEFVFDAPYFQTDSNQMLRFGDFDLEGIYSGTAQAPFTTKLNKANASNMLVNDNLESTYYAKWVGNEKKNRVIKFVFDKPEGETFDLSQTVASVTKFDYASQLSAPTSSQGTSEVGDDGKYVVTFQYDTRCSDTIENYINFNIEMNGGYDIAFEGISFDDEGFVEYDTNFGKLKTNDPLGDDPLGKVVNLETFNKIQFFNLTGDHVFNFVVERETYTDVLELSDERIYLGIGPFEKLKIFEEDGKLSSNVEVGASAYDCQDILEKISADDQTKWEAVKTDDGVNFAIDLLNGQILFSTSKYDAIPFETDLFKFGDKTTMYVRVTHDDRTRTTYILEKEEIQDESNRIPYSVFTLKNETKSKVELTYFLNHADSFASYILYQAFNNFVMIFSTEFENTEAKDAVSFTEIGTYNYHLDDPEKAISNDLKKFNNTEDGKSTKHIVAFNDTFHTFRGVDDNAPMLKAVTTYSTASFNFIFDHEKTLNDADTGMYVNRTNCAPEFVWMNKKQGDLENPEPIELYIENSNYFRFFADRSGEEKVTQYNAASSGLYEDTTQNFNIKFFVLDRTILDDVNDDFSQALNNLNERYFSVEMKKIEKGEIVKFTQEESHTFLHDGYHFTIKYNISADVSLKPGRYDVTFVCTDQLYQLDVGTKFVALEDATDETELENLMNDFLTTEKFDEDGSGISTTAEVTDGGTLTEIKFNDSIKLATTLGDDNGYKFWRWIVRSEETNKIFQSAEIQTGFEQLYQQNHGTEDSRPKEKYRLTVFAVYQRKQAEIALANTIFVDDEEISMDRANNNGITFSLDAEPFVYGQNNEVSSAKITLDGDNKAGYYLDGYRFLNEIGQEVSQTKYPPYDASSDLTASTTQITLDLTWMKNAIKDGELLLDNVSGTVYVVPTIKRKTVTLVFHSGTGPQNPYGDGLDGEVLSVDGTNTTNEVYNFAESEILFEDFVDLSQLVPDEQAEFVGNLFHHRTGFNLDANPWRWKTDSGEGPLQLSGLIVVAQMFDLSQKQAQVHIYRAWATVTCEVVFHANGGVFAEDANIPERSVLIEYSKTYSFEDISALLRENAVSTISRDGYTLVGWTASPEGGTNVFGADGSICAENEEFFKDGRLVNPIDFDVFAQWKENTYVVEIFFNKADTVLGKKVDAQAEQSKKVNFSFDQNFASIVLDDGFVGIDSFTQENVLRNGFVFAGIYAWANGQKVKITNDYFFNTYCPGFVLPESSGEVALSLYIDWKVDVSYFLLDVKNAISVLTFNGEEQTVRLKDFFRTGNFSVKGFDINTQGNDLFALSADVANVELVVKTQTSIQESGNLSFQVRNAGTYHIQLSLVLVDKKIENEILDNNFNFGQFIQIVKNFTVIVEKADIEISTNYANGLYLENLKKLVGTYLSNVADTDEKSLREKLLTAGSLEEATAVLKEFDASVAEKNDNEIYEYFMTRFFLLTHTVETSTQNREDAISYYKNWTYSNFEEFKAENQDLFAQIQSETAFFAFYDFENQVEKVDIKDFDKQESYAKYVSLVGENDFVPRDIVVSKVEISSYSSTLRASNTYSLRIYVRPAQASMTAQLDNFNLLVDDSGEYYFVTTLAHGYVMPQILTVENTSSSKQAYYSNWYETREVPWQTEKDQKEIDGKTYHLLGTLDGKNVYIYVAIETENAGHADQDTVFRYTDPTNFLNFSNVSVLVEDEEDYRDITSDFKFVLDDEDFFVIKSTVGVARISMEAIYLTKYDGITSAGTLPKSLSSSTLFISQIKYDGGSFIDSNLTRLGAYEVEGQLLFEILSNHDNSIEILVGESVQEVTFSVSALQIGQFISLYTMTDHISSVLTGSMETHASKTLTQQEIQAKIDEQGETAEDVVEIDLYAIYTDLVKVTYELNFPEEYEGLSSYESSLKLGEKVTDQIFPQQNGLGKASALFVQSQNGSKEDYSHLNNTEVDGEMVFGGWENVADAAGNVNRFKPFTLSAQWSLPEEMDVAQLMQDRQVAVFTYSTLSAGQVAQILDFNENFFEYEYHWKVEYDDTSLSTPEEFDGDLLSLRALGGKSASGTYTLTITRKVRDIFLNAHTFANDDDISQNVSFHLQFMPYILQEVDPQNLTAEYDGTEHRDDFVVNVKYIAFDNATQAYSATATTEELHYDEEGLFSFTIQNQGQLVTSMVNAGDYEIFMALLEDMFSLDNGLSEEDLTFNFKITPKVFELSGQDFSMQKRFNEDEPDLQKEVEISTGLVVTLQLSRDPGEDVVGEKHVYVEDVLVDEASKKNINFTFNGETIFENGKKVGNTPVGTFTITPSTMLRIELSGQGMEDGLVTAEYNGAAFSLSVNDLLLLISNEKMPQGISLGISLYDETKGESLDDKTEILNILRSHIAGLEADFFKGEIVEAKNRDVYNFNFDNSNSTLKNYYSNVTISTKYRFEILPLKLDIQTNFDKVYDGQAEKIFAVDGRPELQIRATYSSVFVGKNILVNLKLEPTGVGADDFDASNYEIDKTARAEITKLAAKLTFAYDTENKEMQDGKFVYGQVSQSTIKNFLKMSKLETQSGEPTSLDMGLLVQGRYSWNFNFVQKDSTNFVNPRGFLFAGKYAFKTPDEGDSSNAYFEIDAEFQDFEMQIVVPDLEIVQKQVKMEGVTVKTITTADALEEFYEYALEIPQTGDLLSLRFELADHSKGETLPANSYQLKLVEGFDYAESINHSIKVEAENVTLQVVAQTGVVVITLDKSIEKVVYDGTTYSTEVNDKTLTISNNSGETKTYNISATLADQAYEGEISVTITFDKSPAKNAGRYALVLQGSAGEYAIVFDQEYVFEITKKTISVSDLNFDKEYDGSIYTEQKTDFPGKVEGDDVFVYGYFTDANAAEQEKTVHLYEPGGTDGTNYQFDTKDTTAHIKPAQVEIVLSSGNFTDGAYEFEYGKLEKENLLTGLGATVVQDAVPLLQSLFRLKIQSSNIVEEDDYSALGYLKVKDEGYQLEIVADTEVSSQNFEFQPLTAKIVVKPHEISLEISQVIKSLEYGSKAWQDFDGNFEYEIPASLNDLYEPVLVRLSAEGATSKEIGRYRVSGSNYESKNKNYVLKSVTDTTAGALEIVKQATRLFAVADVEGAQTMAERTALKTDYDGKEYDTIIVKKVDESWWLYLQNSSTHDEKPLSKIAFYTLSSSSNDYELYDGEVTDLTASFSLSPKTVKNVTTTPIYVSASNASASSHEIKFGLNARVNPLCDFTLSVMQKKLYFKESYVQMPFNNQDAIYFIEDAHTLLDGLADDEVMSMTIRFEDDDHKLGKYASIDNFYHVLVTDVVGENASQYEVVAKYLSGSGEELDVQGRIDRAEITMNLMLKEMEYGHAFVEEEKVKFDSAYAFVLGRDFTIDFGDLGDFDLDAYRKQGRKFDFSFEIKFDNSQLSSAGFLKVGDYCAEIDIGTENCDFRLIKIFVDGVQNNKTTTSPVLSVTKKVLTISQKGETTLQDIFTRDYDGTLDAKIFQADAGNENDNLLFNLDGIASKNGKVDDVKLSSAQFSDYRGVRLVVTFEMDPSCADCENYEVQPYLDGVINGVKVALQFEIAEGEQSDVDGKMISALAYPFISTSNLTLNTYEQDTGETKNFPKKLTGRAGHVFKYWFITLNLESDADARANQIQKLKEWQSAYGFQFEDALTDEALTVTIIVANDRQTVGLLSELLKDDTFEMNYQNQVTVVFHAKWEAETYALSVQFADENGQNIQEAYGRVEADQFDESLTQKQTFDNFFTYGQEGEVELQVYADKHAKFEAFFVNGTRILGGEISGVGNFEILTYADHTSLKISNVLAALNLSIRFRAQKVDVVLDIPEALSGQVEVDGSLFDEDFVWHTNYFEIKDKTFADLPSLHIVGRELRAFKMGEREIAVADFASTKLFESDLTEDTRITLTPIVEAKSIAVVLDFGFDGLRQTVFVVYGYAFSTATDENGENAWQEEIQQAGHEFLGWFADPESEETKVTGEDLLLIEDLVLYAHWQTKKFQVSITLENVEVESTPADLMQTDGKLIAQDVDFERSFTFVIRASAGYVLPEVWDERFEVSVDAQGKATITFMVGDEDFEATISALALEQKISYSGENIGQVDVFDVTEDETKIVDIAVENGIYSFTSHSGRTIKFEVNALVGFEMTTDVSVEISGKVLSEQEIASRGIVLSKSITDGVLVCTISGFLSDISIKFVATQRLNIIKIGFDDLHPNAIERITVGGNEFSAPTEEIPVDILTGQELTFDVTFSHGFDLDSLTLFDEEDSLHIKSQTQFASTNSYRFVLDGILCDGSVTINTKLKIFTLSLNVTSIDKQNQKVDESGNALKALQGDERVTQISVEYGTSVTLVLENVAGYKFLGWSRDGETVIQESEWEDFGISAESGVWKFVVNDNSQVWAIFSQADYTITLHTYDYALVDDALTNIEEKYIEIPGEYFDLENTPISNITISSGQEKTILFNVPTGYMFHGWGFFEPDGRFKILEAETQEARQISVTITPLAHFGTTFVEDIYMLAVPYFSTIHVVSQIDFKGQLGEDFDVGKIELSNRNGDVANEFGYVDGALVHYADVDNMTSRDFDIQAYTQIEGHERDAVYLKVYAPRDGYYFDRIEINHTLSYEVVLSQPEFVIYRIFGLYGKVDGVEIKVIYAPILNAVEISFLHDDHIASGGIFEVSSQPSDIIKLWTSGDGFSSITVSAFTDMRFSVTAYIRAGFFVDGATLESLKASVRDSKHVIVDGSLQYVPLSIEETGFTGKITFDVFGFANICSIQIVLQDTKYTVVFKDGDQTLARVRHVGFDTDLKEHLSQDNSANIVERSVDFIGGQLNLLRTLKGHNFEGYFTKENGAGKYYIDTIGRPIMPWQENGYVLSTATGKYELAQNVKVNEFGEIEIPLYAYLSYFKTRIKFNFVPEIDVNYTAKDIVTGVDETNSWFNSSNPNYIEISFNTDIYICAPEINGYKFHQFIINQKTFDGIWLDPVVAYQEKTPWSTNEVEKVVQMEIDIVYFAKLDVEIIGGEAKPPVITQETSDTHAQALLEEGFFDTSLPLTISAEPENGYDFLRWEILGQRYTTKTATLSASQAIVAYMILEGERVVLDFNDYDVQNGQIVRMSIQSMDGSRQEIPGMVEYRNGRYVKKINQKEVKVGDTITFAVSMANNLTALWNRDDIILKNYDASSRLTYYTFKVPGEEATKTIKIIPEFTAARKTIYVSRRFASNEILGRALDGNNVDLAVFALMNGNAQDVFYVETGKDIQIELLLNARYAIKKVSVRSGDFTNDNFQLEDNKINLTNQFMTDEEHPFGGNIFIDIEVTRLMWENFVVEADSFDGTGTQKSPYHIKNKEQLVLMMQLSNSGQKDSRGVAYRQCAYVLDADIDLDERFWTPIGTNEFPFDGWFNFNGHYVKNICLSLLYDRTSYNGLFGVLGSNAKIISGPSFWWWWLLIILILIFLTVLLTWLIYRNKKKKKENEEMAKR